MSAKTFITDLAITSANRSKGKDKYLVRTRKPMKRAANKSVRRDPLPVYDPADYEVSHLEVIEFFAHPILTPMAVTEEELDGYLMRLAEGVEVSYL